MYDISAHILYLKTEKLLLIEIISAEKVYLIILASTNC